MCYQLEIINSKKQRTVKFFLTKAFYEVFGKRVS